MAPSGTVSKCRRHVGDGRAPRRQCIGAGIMMVLYRQNVDAVLTPRWHHVRATPAPGWCYACTIPAACWETYRCASTSMLAWGDVEGDTAPG